MAKIFKSKFKLLKRYSKFSNTCVFFFNKNVRYGYKFYQKIFRKYKGSQNLRINVRKPRLAIRRKTIFGKALEMKEKFSYLLGGLHSSKLRRYCRLSKSKYVSPSVSFINKLEKRLDVILYRSNIFMTPTLSRAAIQGGFISVNGNPTRIASYILSVNDFIDVKVPPYSYGGTLTYFSSAINKGTIFKPEPRHLAVSYKIFRVIVTKDVSLTDIFYPFDFSVHYFYRLYSLLLFIFKI